MVPARLDAIRDVIYHIENYDVTTVRASTPMSKEEYFYRSIFSEHFPSDSAASCVPSVPSVACSTAEALAWDASFKNMIDPSGRAVKSVHIDSYK